MKTLDELAEAIHRISTSKGFTAPNMDNLPEKLMLSVSELAECMEEHRKGRGLRYYTAKRDGEDIPVHMGPDGHWYYVGGGSRVPPGALKPEGILPELADSIIRDLHMMFSLIEDWNNDVSPDDAFPDTVAGVIEEKVAFNEGRPLMHGGNAY